MSDSYWLIVVIHEFLLADCSYSEHDARTRGHVSAGSIVAGAGNEVFYDHTTSYGGW